MKQFSKPVKIVIGLIGLYVLLTIIQLVLKTAILMENW